MARFGRAIRGAVALVLVAGGVVGCAPRPSAPVEPIQQVKLAGSGTCYPLVKLLTDEYERAHPGTAITFLPVTHSVGGIKAVETSLAEIGMVSRALTPEEKKLGLGYRLLSQDGLVVATNPDVKISSVTRQQIRDIYAGKLRDWSQLGAPRAPIVVLDRNEDESAKIVLRTFVLGKKLKTMPEAVRLFYESDMIDALEKTPGAIGYFSLGDAISKRRVVNLLKVDDVAPTVANVVDGKYDIVRPLGLVFENDLGPGARAVLDYMLSEKAATFMSGKGYVPAGRG